MKTRGTLPEIADEPAIPARDQDDLAKALSAIETQLTGGGQRDAASKGPDRRALAQRIRIERASRLLARGSFADAAAGARDALDCDPTDATALTIASDALLGMKDPASLMALLDVLESRGVQSSTLLASRANALAASNAFAALEQLLKPSQWCKQVMIEDPTRDRLAELIFSHPEMNPASMNVASRGRNRRLEALASRNEPEIRSALSMIRRQVDIYVEERRHFAHPLMLQYPSDTQLQGWALETLGDGHEARHIHVHGWLTAVYYLRVPEREARAVSPPPGSLVFGPWPAPMHQSEYVFPGWHIEPSEGMLMIFPSFLAHQTVPTETSATRLCLSLDVMSRPPAALRQDSER